MLSADKPRKLGPFCLHVGCDVTLVDNSFAQAIADPPKTTRGVALSTNVFNSLWCVQVLVEDYLHVFLSLLFFHSLRLSLEPIVFTWPLQSQASRPRLPGWHLANNCQRVCVCMRVSIFFAYYSRSSCNLFNHLFTLSVNSRCLSPSLSQGLGDVSLYVHLVHCQAWTHSSLTLAEDSTDTWGKSVRELGSAFSWWRRISCYTSCMHACLSAACREIGNLGNGTP